MQKPSHFFVFFPREIRESSIRTRNLHWERLPTEVPSAKYPVSNGDGFMGNKATELPLPSRNETRKNNDQGSQNYQLPVFVGIKLDIVHDSKSGSDQLETDHLSIYI